MAQPHILASSTPRSPNPHSHQDPKQNHQPRDRTRPNKRCQLVMRQRPLFGALAEECVALARIALGRGVGDADAPSCGVEVLEAHVGTGVTEERTGDGRRCGR